MKTKFLTLTVLTLLLFACQTESDDVFIEESALKEIPVKAPIYVDLGNTVQSISVNTIENDLLKSTETRKVALYMAEYLSTGDIDEMGNIVYFMNVGNKQLGADFVPGVALDGSDDVSYYVDDNRPTVAMDVSISNAAIDRGMATWEGVNCSELGMTELPFDGRPTGGVAAILGFEGSTLDYVSDVVHAGWMPGLFFDIIAPPDGSTFILGVTFTFIFVDGGGVPTDIDNNGKNDVAWREIYYNDVFPWGDGNEFAYDVETVALHEAGHGLSQGHFGKAFRTVKNWKLHFSPRAVMNAGYSGIQTSIGKTDNAGHCSNWAQWPKK